MPTSNPYGQLAQAPEYGAELPTGSFGRDISDAPDEVIDHWNQQWRGSPLYRRIIQRMGLNPDQSGGVHLTEAQRLELQGELNQAMGGQFAGHDVHIDRAGNMHGNSSLIKRIAMGAAIGGAALTGFGLAGMGPLAGLGGAGAAGAGGAEAAGAGGAGAAGAGAAGAGATGAGATGAAVLPSTVIGTGAVPGLTLAPSALMAAGGSGAIAAAPTIASAVTTAAASHAPSWLAPVLTAGTSAAGTIVGSALQARANRRAAELQSAYLHEALEYEKARDIYGYTTEGNRYAAMANAEQPYIDTGRAADARMAEMMGLPAPSPSRTLAPPPTYPVTGTPGMPSPLPTSPNDTRNRIPGYDPTTGVLTPQAGTPGQNASWSNPPSTAGGPSVMMRAPDGTVKAIPVAQIQHYEQMGAVRV